MVAEACRTVPELHIPEETLLEAKIRKLAACVHDAKTEMTKAQFELNLKITELELNAQPSTPPEVREQCEAAVKDAAATVDAAVEDCTTLSEQSMEVVTTLQKDPNMQRLNTESHKLQ